MLTRHSSCATIVPGGYPGRTRHFHVKVQRPGGRVLTTQLYFPGEPLNRRDGLFDERLLLRLAAPASGRRVKPGGNAGPGRLRHVGNPNRIIKAAARRVQHQPAARRVLRSPQIISSPVKRMPKPQACATMLLAFPTTIHFTAQTHPISGPNATIPQGGN